MFKLLFKWVIPLVIMLAVFFVGYNYYYGNEQEREQSKVIVSKVTDLGREVFGLLQSEKEKFDAGKYNDAMSKIQASLQSLRRQIADGADNGNKLTNQLNNLEQQRTNLEQQLRNFSTESPATASRTTRDEDGASVSIRNNNSKPSLDTLNDQFKNLVSQIEQLGGAVERNRN